MRVGGLRTQQGHMDTRGHPLRASPTGPESPPSPRTPESPPGPPEPLPPCPGAGVTRILAPGKLSAGSVPWRLALPGRSLQFSGSRDQAAAAPMGGGNVPPWGPRRPAPSPHGPTAPRTHCPVPAAAARPVPSRQCPRGSDRSRSALWKDSAGRGEGRGPALGGGAGRGAWSPQGPLAALRSWLTQLLAPAEGQAGRSLERPCCFPRGAAGRVRGRLG